MDEVAVDELKTFYAKDYGFIRVVEDTYAKGREKLENMDADISDISARNFVDLMLYSYSTDFYKILFDFCGSEWFSVTEEIVYLEEFENPILFLDKGPIYYNPNKAYLEKIKKEGDICLDDTELNMPKYLKEYGSTWTEALKELINYESDLLKENDINPLEVNTFEMKFLKDLDSRSFYASKEDLIEVNPEKLSNPDYFKSLSDEVKVFSLLLKDQIEPYSKVLSENLETHKRKAFYLLNNVPDRNTALNMATHNPSVSPLFQESYPYFIKKVVGTQNPNIFLKEISDKYEDRLNAILELGINTREDIENAWKVYQNFKSIKETIDE